MNFTDDKETDKEKLYEKIILEDMNKLEYCIDKYIFQLNRTIPYDKIFYVVVLIV